MVIILMVACGPLPRPFQPSSKTVLNPLIEQGVPADVAVNPVQGTSIPMAKLLMQSVVSEITRYDIVSYANDRGTSRFILDGEVVDESEATSGKPDRHIRWVLKTREGVTTGEHVAPITASSFEWDYGSPKIIRDVGVNTASAVAKLVLGRTATLAGDKQARKGIWVKPITDAPGDGNFSLTRAIAFALGDSGTSISRTPERAEYVLKARVRVDSPESGTQKVEIVWIISDPEGKEIGRARQRNTVAAGAFDGRWGRSAVMISLAAVGAIKNILVNKASRSLTLGKPPITLVYPEPEKGQDPVIPPPTLTPN